jgi:hypothetical protein
MYEGDVTTEDDPVFEDKLRNQNVVTIAFLESLIKLAIYFLLEYCGTVSTQRLAKRPSLHLLPNNGIFAERWCFVQYRRIPYSRIRCGYDGR